MKLGYCLSSLRLLVSGLFVSGLNAMANPPKAPALGDWQTHGQARLVQVATPVQSGAAHALQLCERAKPSDGAKLDLTATLTPGSIYNVSIWFRSSPGPRDRLLLRLLLEDAGEIRQIYVTAANSSEAEFAEIRGTFTAPSLRLNEKISLYLLTLNEATPLFIGDVKITPVTPPWQLLLQRSAGNDCYSLALSPQSQGENSTQAVRITLTASDETILAGPFVTLPAQTELTLPAGYYRLADSAAAETAPAASKEQVFAVGDPAVLLAAACARADAILARTDLAAYRGWIKFLRREAEVQKQRTSLTHTTALARAQRLDGWTRRILANPQIIASLRGEQEWAYESPADGSGQPFRVTIPAAYRPDQPLPVVMYLHGGGGFHLDRTPMAESAGALLVSVMGRSRRGSYIGLSEADALHVLDYVQAHWATDTRRIHLGGASMGGWGSFWLGSRYPHRWTSIRPACGWASTIPANNLVTLPVYALHSDDDWSVPILHVRNSLTRLNENGGTAILDETSGLGHNLHVYAEGLRRAEHWRARQFRPTSADVRRIDFTALDGTAVRSWWAEISEWGPAPRPARFAIRVGEANQIYAQLTNIARLRVDLSAGPFDLTKPLAVSIEGAVPLAMPAPLPAQIELVRTEKGWILSTATAAPPRRLHTPGGPLQLYDGSPLLIVYGTRGDARMQAALRAAAETASRNPNPGWPAPGTEIGPEGLSREDNLYGYLPLKADTAVTDDDVARCNLVLIGSAAQNTLVAWLADQLPVRLSDGVITCSDTQQFPAAHHALGLVHFNPLAPRRLLFWVATEDPAGYAPNATVTLLGARFPIGADLIIASATSSTLVAARSFDSHWQWTPGRARSPLLPATLQTHGALALARAEAIRRAIAADFAIATPTYPNLSTAACQTPGSTRVADINLFHYYEPIGIMELSGSELLAADRLLKAAATNSMWTCLHPQLDSSQIHATRLYRVALPISAIWSYCEQTRTAPRSYRQTELEMSEVLERFLIPE
ncbi:MAG: carbohydrate binding domain-containing protein [Opitutae bacterium]|nr:carbohydrate binding domain-containing protein [Opitutae bacterium]